MSGALTHTPLEICEQHLSDLSLGTLVSASSTWPIYRAVLPDTPNNCIHLQSSEPQLHGRQHVDGKVRESYGIHLTVRSDGPSGGRDKMEAIRAALDSVSRDTVTISGSTYLVHSIRRIGGPLEVGHASPSDKRFIFTLDFYLKVEQQT